MNYEARMKRLLLEMRRRGMTELIVSEPAALWYLTGESIHPGERLTVLVIDENGGALWVRNRLFPLKKELSAGAKLEADTINDRPYSDGEDPIGILAGVLSKGVCGVDKTWHAHFLLSLMEARRDMTFVNGSEAVDAVRAVKDADEILLMRKASAINDRAMVRLIQELHEGITEKETAARLLDIYDDEGAEGFSFPPVISFGAHGADPHHEPDDTPLVKNTAVLLDIGCRKNGYASDMTRTLFYGTPTEEEVQVHRIVAGAQKLAVSMIHPGVPLASLDRAAREWISRAGYGEAFTHRLGHFIGITAHEAGEVAGTSPLIAEPGMIFSIEPGIYLPGKFGVRIEDLVLVTDEGHELLNHVPYDFLIS